MWRWIKIPKAVALLAFLLPWMSVSCSNNTLVSATGFGLAAGKFTSELPGRTPATGEWNLYLVIAITALVMGLVIAFLRRGRTTAGLSLTTTAAALLFIWLGTSRYTKAAVLEQASKTRATAVSEVEQAAASMINVNWHYGYWLALAALLAAAAIAALVLSGKDPDFEQRR
ncbi:hypothetical protein LQ953_07890 [Sphingomonas sp. IC-56]|uniref:hypothetical protein n=1 Tax=Sphingomonas sp. IC-56 TaxID=2898529 RepID=UPI001E4CFF34|nr:hypothetical protein [Sphingomonas sp. IC-56]MCD2323932.1 hypothetical protein [Sphingomonas sp. IC-56]